MKRKDGYWIDGSAMNREQQMQELSQYTLEKEERGKMNGKELVSYVLARGSSEASLVIDIDLYLQQGYELHGSPFVVNNGIVTFYQAMIKYKQEEEQV